MSTSASRLSVGRVDVATGTKLTAQNQILGGRSLPLPQGENSQRNQIGQQPQNDLE